MIKVIGVGQNGDDVVLQVADALKLELPGSPGTGSIWLFTGPCGPPALRLESQTYTADRPGTPGSPGTFTWVWKAARVGVTELSLTHLRPWEPEQPSGEFRVA